MAGKLSEYFQVFRTDSRSVPFHVNLCVNDCVYNHKSKQIRSANET